MPKFNASLCLYFISGFLFFIAVMINNAVLAFVVKPIIIPSILFYYFSIIRNKTNDLFILSFVLFFIGDMTYLINQNDYYYLGLFVFLFPYAIILYHLYEDFKILLKKRRNVIKIDYSIIIVLVLLIYLLFSILNFLNFKSSKEFIYAILIGLELFSMTILTAFIFIYSSHRKNGYLAFAISMFILSDVFFMLDVQFLDLLVFKIINALAQTASYYFYVKYFIRRGNVKRVLN